MSWFRPRWLQSSGTTRSALSVCILSGLTTLGLCVVSGEMLRELRADIWTNAQENSHNLLHLAEQDTARNIDLFDLSLNAVLDNMHKPGLGALSPELQHAVLFDRAATARYLGAIAVMDEKGNVTADSLGMGAHPENFGDRDYFTHHRDTLDTGFYISKPYVSSRTGEMSIGVSRRISQPDGSFGGIVMGSMRLGYFRDLFDRLSLGRKGSISLFRTDGTLLMRQPYSRADIGRSLARSATFARFSAGRTGSFIATSTIDGVERLNTYTHVGNLPLIIDVALSVDDVLAVWWRKAKFVGFVVVGLCGLTALLTIRLLRELRERGLIEAKLRQANRELGQLAVTDGLTGLFNRRRFDEIIAREWRRSSRAGASLALVTVDVDNFKSYNDHYGHSGGDDVLRTVAAQLISATGRSSDVVCRVGGEEFAVILPDTDGAGAMIVAERIRASVAKLGIPHEGSPGGVVTVSVGVAQKHEPTTRTIEDLATAADEALYAAKRGGRNRVEASTDPDFSPVPVGARPGGRVIPHPAVVASVGTRRASSGV